MCVPSLNEICESIIELLRTQVKIYSSGGGMMDMNPVYLQFSSGGCNDTLHAV